MTIGKRTKQHRSRAVRRIQRILKNSQKTGEYEKDNFVRDILADLRHYADSEGMDFASEDGVAYQNYSAEVVEDRRGRK